MLKILLQRLFRVGRIPADTLPTLQAEGLELLEEGVWGSITYRNFRAPGRYSNWKRQWFLGAIAVTSQRIIGYGWYQPYFNIAYDNPVRVAKVTFRLESPQTFCASSEAGNFRPDQSGTIELRYTTPHAAFILDRLQQKGMGENQVRL